MAEFKRSYNESEMMEGENCMMTDGTNLGTGFVGGLLVGGLAGWAFNRGDRYRDGGYPYPYPVPTPMNHGCGGFTHAEVDNLIATKDAQYEQLNATQTAEFNTINRIDTLGINLASGLASLGYEGARLSNANQIQTMQSANQLGGLIAESSAKADMCCCQTQGLIKEKSAETQGQIAAIVPEMKNFYLADEVEKLRIKAVQTENAYQFGALTTQLASVGAVVNQIHEKVNTPST